MGRPGTFNATDAQIIFDHVDDHNLQFQMFGEDAVKKHLKSTLRILVRAEDILNQEKGSYRLLHARAKIKDESLTFNQEIETPCLVACGHWHKIGHFSGDPVNLLNIFKKPAIPFKGKNIGEWDSVHDRFDALRPVMGGHEGLWVNIVHHFDKLLPKNRNCVGLFTFQNGIQNTVDDFEEMGKSIINKLTPEKPLCIGLYNKTNGVPIGFFEDFTRLAHEWKFNPYSVLFFRQMVATFSEILHSINPNLLWTHIAHSEGGLIANEVFTTKTNRLMTDHAAIIQKQLIVATLGGVAGTPDSAVKKAFNIYSKDDVTMFFAKKHLDKIPWPDTSGSDSEMRKVAQDLYDFMPDKTRSAEEIYLGLKRSRDEYFKRFYIASYPYPCTKNGYTLEIVDSHVPKSELPFIKKDHDFQGATYQFELKRLIKKLRDVENKFGGIYDGQ